MRSFIKAIALFIAIVLALFGALLWNSKIPLDSEVQQRFVRDKATLADLAAMLSQESPKIIGITPSKVMVDDPSNWIEPTKAGFSDDHFAKYKALMQKAKIINLFRRDGQVVFAIAGFGFAGEGWRMGFVYSATRPPHIVDSIDHLSLPDESEAYRPLADNWYIWVLQ